jgi:sugar/nucleoside kinase (ribokinase family)
MSRSAQRRTRIISLDYHSVDLVTREADQPKLLPLLADFNMPAGSKRDISPFPELRQQFISALDSSKVIACPGGSAGNALYTLAGLLPERAECQLLGIIGNTPHAQTIRDSYHSVGVLLVEPPVEGAVGTENHGDVASAVAADAPCHATACVVVDDSGQSRTITLDDGHARRWLNADMIPDMLVQASDVMLFPASTFNKFSRDVPEKLLRLSDEYNCALWMTLPTRRPLPEAHREQVRELIRTRAQLVLGNESELREIYGAGQTLQKTIADLKHDLLLQQEAMIARDILLEDPPCAFITRGEEGAIIVMPDKAFQVSVMHVPRERIENPTGAGDASFGGFLAGYLRGFPLPRCAALGVAMGAAAVQTLTTRLNDPLGVLNHFAPELQILLEDA